MRKTNKKFNRFNTTSHAIAKTKKSTTDRDTGKVTKPCNIKYLTVNTKNLKEQKE